VRIDKVNILAERRVEKARTMTFRGAADSYIKLHEVERRNPKHRQQRGNTLETYVHPLIGDLPVAAVDTDVIVKILTPILRAKAKTARRVRQRIESILGWATASKFRAGEQPGPP
jgi:hypothetical protein